jgi:hypothetical protein
MLLVPFHLLHQLNHHYVMMLQGEEYVFRPDWGEQLEGKHQSVVVVCDTESDTVSVLEGIPAHLSPGQVIWTPDGKGIVGIAWESEPRRLGLVYCTNRQSCVFHVTGDGVFSEFNVYYLSKKDINFKRLGTMLTCIEI